MRPQRRPARHCHQARVPPRAKACGKEPVMTALPAPPSAPCLDRLIMVMARRFAHAKPAGAVARKRAPGNGSWRDQARDEAGAVEAWGRPRWQGAARRVRAAMPEIGREWITGMVVSCSVPPTDRDEWPCRPVSWLAGRRRLVCTFPGRPEGLSQWFLADRLAAYSCGGSRGLKLRSGSRRLLDRP